MPDESKQCRRRCGVMWTRLRHASVLAILVLLCALRVRAETCEEKGLVGQCK